MNLTTPWWIRIPGLLACGFIGTSGQWSGSPAEAAGSWVEASTIEAPRIEGVIVEDPVTEGRTRESALRDDARVMAFVRAYGSLIDSVTYRDDDVVFTIAGRAIHFQDGRMLAEENLDRRERCDPIFYRYSLEPLTEPIAPSDKAVRFCTDLQEVLWGRTEDQIRAHARSTTFLDRRMFLNDLAVQALGEVERDILAISSADPAVASWIDQVDITYSFINRGIAGTSTRSQHAWGLAVDLVPNSYEGRQVYWRWTRAWNRSGWHRIPLEQRWSPPEAVVEIFERHGFLWGGKWAHFDNIHFEYRPEILEYNRLIEADGP
jgi:hypothetical protein